MKKSLVVSILMMVFANLYGGEINTPTSRRPMKRPIIRPISSEDFARIARQNAIDKHCESKCASWNKTCKASCKATVCTNNLTEVYDNYAVLGGFSCGYNGNGEKKLQCQNGEWKYARRLSRCKNDPDVCTNGRKDNDVCGINSNGNQKKICKGGQWIKSGSCIDSDVCLIGKSKDVNNDVNNKCGLNGKGITKYKCNTGLKWDFDRCEGDYICKNGTKSDDLKSCGFNKNGYQPMICKDEDWAKNGACVEVDECENNSDETQTIKCGFNKNGKQNQVCSAGNWTNNGTCAEVDECENNSTQDIKCGHNENGKQNQVCSAGNWANSGTCVDPDECKNGKYDPIACGPNSRGSQEKTCSAGKWKFGSCADSDVCEDDTVTKSEDGFSINVCTIGQPKKVYTSATTEMRDCITQSMQNEKEVVAEAITSLTCIDAGFVDQEIAELSEFKTLITVDLSQNPLKDISVLKKLSNLETVTLNTTKLSGADNINVVEYLIFNGADVSVSENCFFPEHNGSISVSSDADYIYRNEGNCDEYKLDLDEGFNDELEYYMVSDREGKYLIKETDYSDISYFYVPGKCISNINDILVFESLTNVYISCSCIDLENEVNKEIVETLESRGVSLNLQDNQPANCE